jgi:hypothetical protein
MARQVQNLSSLVEGEETCRKIIAAQTAAQENAIVAMHTQRNDLQGQLTEANRKLSEASAELNRLNWQQAQHLQTADDRYVCACECLYVRERARDSDSERGRGCACLCVVARICTYRYTHVHRMYIYTRTQPHRHARISCPPTLSANRQSPQ